MDLVKKLKTFHHFLLGTIGQENVFHDFLERKKAFLNYKNKELNKSKNWDFSKGVSPCFWSKKLKKFPSF